MQTIDSRIDADGIATLCFDAQGAKVNTMTAAWEREMIAAVEQLHADRARLKGVLLTSAKSTFFAGAPLRELLALRESEAAEGFRGIEAIKHAYRRLETLGRPVAALLDGAALGGGWELALAAHARFARDDEALRFGMPEVTLGLIPGASGIVKTVRLLGLLAAYPYLVEGRLFGPREALQLGLVQGLAERSEGLRAQALAWIAAHPDAAQPWDRPGYRLPGGAPAEPKLAAALSIAPAALAARTHGRYPAPQAALQAMVEGALVDIDTALRIESRKLARLMVGQVAKNMITAFFFQRQALRDIAWPPPGFPPWRRDAAATPAWPQNDFTRRLRAAFADEAATMHAEGRALPLIAHAARAAGMTIVPPVVAAAPASPVAEPIPAAAADELTQRLLYRQTIEAARCLADAVVGSVAEANLGSVFGAGFPAWAGGALQFVASEGLEAFETRAAALAARHGPRFALDAALRETLRRGVAAP